MAILENTVLGLIPILIALIIAESFIEKAGRLSAAQHGSSPGPIWRSARCSCSNSRSSCCLAPHRTSYFLHHLLIDLLASLPFGFVAHQIELDRMGDRPRRRARGRCGGRPDRAGWRGLRFMRVVLPVVRLARVGLILLRLADRLVHRMGRLLNRNIVLFEPCEPRSRNRATAID